MLEIKEEELNKVLPSDGPSINEVKKYLEKYNDEYIVIKCGGSVLVDNELFDIFYSFSNYRSFSGVFYLFKIKQR